MVKYILHFHITINSLLPVYCALIHCGVGGCAAHMTATAVKNKFKPCTGTSASKYTFHLSMIK